MAVSLRELIEAPHGYSGPDVPDDDLLRACVHCGMCLPTCPTYRLTGEEASSPRGRLWMMRAVADGRLDLLDPEFDEQMYQCLNCRACEAVCPSGVHYGPLVEAARSQLEQHRPRPVWQRAARKVGLDLPFARIERMRFMVNVLRVYQRSHLGVLLRRTGVLRVLRLETLEAMLPPITELPLISGEERWTPPSPVGRVALFNGCVMSTVFANVNRSAARVMAHNGLAVEPPASQQCCGALHVHAGMMEEARTLARTNIDAFEESGEPIIVTAAGCGAALKEYSFLLKDDPVYADRAARFSERVRDVTEFLGERDLVPPTHAVDTTVTYQEPCHLAHAQRITRQPRALLAQVPGLRLEEMNESSLCCGSAGIYNIIRKEMADDLGDRKVKHVLATGAENVVTANPGCAMQLRTSLRRNGSTLPVRHIVEILDDAYGGEAEAKEGRWAFQDGATRP
ncbi:MAG: Glycolate dehydrogenase, iron-sulfur subunit GlcF [uncultured Thermomicrobiales bacterium]|uniref:Glycolate oxidase iron-sulfur subunit n=1 Tax=uncultured Thermomicrobiales bacterium TaxID=1645740 RepID=A0A6J4UI20_9BACT|nr:MAG: Glycolate dehydrogenase, iron-sulfur subunit GlcF [uncultured Thermomicrobiales bacterium]